MTATAIGISPRRIFADGYGWEDNTGHRSGLVPADLDPTALPIQQSLFLTETSSLSPASLRQLWRNIRGRKPMTASGICEAIEVELISDHAGATTMAWGDLYAVNAVTLTLDDDTISAAAAAEQALRSQASDSFARLSRLVLRFCAWKAGALPLAGDAATQVALQAAGNQQEGSPTDILVDVLDLTLAAAIEFSQLRVATAERLARCAFRYAAQTAPTGVLPAGILGRILYSQGLVREAEQLVRPWLARLHSAGSLDCVCEAYIVLVGAAVHAGDYATALATLDEACALAEERNWPRLLAAMLAERVRLCEPDCERHARAWLEQLANLSKRYKPKVRCARSEIACYSFRAQVSAFLKFKIGPPPHAALAHLQHNAWLGRDPQALRWLKLAQCQVLWTVGEENAALDHLVEVLQTTEATGLRQLLIDAGPPLGTMIGHLVQNQCLDPALLAFSICLMEDIGSAAGKQAASPRRRTGMGGGRLTDRERDVLRMIGEGYTNKLIAQRQGVAPETIKTHLKNIFLKLGVERRAQAVTKAKRLGML
ncbi:LuxR C-terminal-related transcriptional regulator (plasmid) [Mesorhizobium sp. ORM8.1]